MSGESGNWIPLAQNMDMWLAVLNNVTNIRVLLKGGISSEDQPRVSGFVQLVIGAQ